MNQHQIRIPALIIIGALVLATAATIFSSL